MFDKLAVDFQGHHIQGEKVAIGLGVTAATLGLVGLRRYFQGGRCYIEKDLTGFTAVVTGGNTGIGKQTCRRLADLGCFVILGARDTKKNEETVAELLKTAKGKIVALRLDLADKASISEFAQEVQIQLGGRGLNYLINNAGIMAIPQRKTTKDGFEMQIGVNHFGHFYLTHLLWPQLKKAGNPRIINVSSMAHRHPGSGSDIDLRDIHFENNYDAWQSYSRSKKANILFTSELQKRMDAAGINGITISLHPGAVRTQLLREYVGSLPRKLAFWIFASPIYYLTFKTAEQGAQTSLYGVLEREDKLKKGTYYKDCAPTKLLSKQCEDQELARELWETSERLLRVKFDL